MFTVESKILQFILRIAKYIHVFANSLFEGAPPSHNKAYPLRSEYLTWASPHCAKGRATSGKQDVMRNNALNAGDIGNSFVVRHR